MVAANSTRAFEQRAVLKTAVVATGSYANVTGLEFYAEAGLTYRFEFHYVWDAGAVTTGAEFSINGTATPTALAYSHETGLTTTTTTLGTGLSDYNLPAATGVTSPATTGNSAVVWGVITPLTSGFVTGRVIAENLTDAITVKAGLTYVQWERIADQGIPANAANNA